MRARLPAAALLLLLLCASSLARQEAARREAASADYTDDALFRQAVLNVTNTFRAQHNATALRWNASLAGFAQKWSARCAFEHSGGPSGENLSSGYPSAAASILVWGEERREYDFERGGFTHETGHFSQLVWKATRTVGCGRTECNGEDEGEAPGWFVVCEYDPPGNVLGRFAANVQAQVPEGEQPAGPGDPDVPEEEEPEECPLGADCSAGMRRGVWGVGVVGWAGMWMWVLM